MSKRCCLPMRRVRISTQAIRATGAKPSEPFDRVLFSCESLKVTTRLMHIIAWLLTQRAVDAGELSSDQVREPSRRLGPAVASDDAGLDRLPDEARKLIATSVELYRRVERLDAGMAEDM